MEECAQAVCSLAPLVVTNNVQIRLQQSHRNKAKVTQEEQITGEQSNKNDHYTSHNSVFAKEI